jgi:hypothetical protein
MDEQFAVVHWDLENMPVPRGASAIQVCNQLRDAVLARLGRVRALYGYVDVAKAPPALRQELAMAGVDVIDCSTTQGKPGQVDLRIVARALTTSPSDATAIVTGDADFAYVLSQLRAAGRNTALVYDSTRMSVVSTALLDVANVAIGVSFSKEAFTDTEAAACDDAGGSQETQALRPPSGNEELFIEALRRSPEAEADGWKLGTNVGELFGKLTGGQPGKSAFKETKARLVSARRIEVNTAKDTLRVTSAGGR